MLRTLPAALTRFTCLTVLVATLCAVPRYAAADGPDGRDFGVGIVLGEPTGLTLKYFVASAHAVGAHFAYDLSDGGYALFVDYLIHLWPFDDADGVSFPFYFGIGGNLLVLADLADDDLAVGLRAPIGMAAHFDIGVEVFLEVGPGLRVVPATGFDISGGIGGRYYF